MANIPVLLIATLVVLGAFTPETALARCADQAAPGVNWSGCVKDRLLMGKHNLHGARMVKTSLNGSDLAGTNLKDAVLTKASMSRLRLTGADLSGADLSGVVGSRTQMQNTKLVGTNLSKAELSRVNLEGADLSRANLAEAQLVRGNLRRAKLDAASLKNANLARADLRQASLGGADLWGTYALYTRIEGLDLSGAQGLSQLQLDMACGDQATELPAGLTAPSTWPCQIDDDG